MTKDDFNQIYSEKELIEQFEKGRQEAIADEIKWLEEFDFEDADDKIIERLVKLRKLKELEKK